MSVRNRPPMRRLPPSLRLNPHGILIVGVGLLVSGTLFNPSAMAQNATVYSSETIQTLGTISPQDLSGVTDTPTAEVIPQVDPLEATSGFTQPAIIQSGMIRYMTGGVSSEERDDLRGKQSDFNLTLQIATKEGDLVGDVPLTITNAEGTVILTIKSGPLFYANLPAGRYTVAVGSANTKRQQKNFTLSRQGRIHLRFTW